MPYDKILTPMTDYDTFKGLLKVFKLQRCLITNHNVSVAPAIGNEGVTTKMEKIKYTCSTP